MQFLELYQYMAYSTKRPSEQPEVVCISWIQQSFNKSKVKTVEQVFRLASTEASIKFYSKYIHG